jgi:pimeloyl-ACP methyl ester carboxylesterase
MLAPGFGELGAGSAQRMLRKRRERLDAVSELGGQRRITESEGTIPSWDLVGTIDNAIPSSIQLFMANRAHAQITEVKAGHLSMISQPAAVTKVIEEAAQSVASRKERSR